jgi:hypothetical protein
MFREGDIVEIPLPGDRVAIGWIIHISQLFKNTVGFVILGIKGTIQDQYIDSTPGLNIIGPFYTHSDALEHYKWRVCAHQPVSESRRLLLTKRRVGGDVYVGDNYIGSAEELDEHNLRPMLVMGMPIVYSTIEKAFGDDADMPT